MQETRTDTLVHGLIAGLVGYATAAATFAIADVVGGHSPFRSMAMLGATLFYGPDATGAGVVTAPHVFAGNGTYMLVFVAFGLIASSLAALADRGAQLWFLALFLVLFLGFHVIAVAQLLAASVAADGATSIIWVGGVAAMLTMGAYLVWAHPQLRTAERWDG